jgi:hypothetical protein
VETGKRTEGYTLRILAKALKLKETVLNLETKEKNTRLKKRIRSDFD